MASRFNVEDVKEIENDQERTSKEEVSIRFSDDLARTNAEDTGSKKKCQTVNQVSITSEASLALYQEELERRPMISSVLTSLPHSQPDGPSTDEKKKSNKKGSKLGTIMGVYLPTLQNILGVILFLRLTWIVGTAGVGQALLIVFLCCSCTFLTTLSLSAIATNGVVPGGGSYFVISRNMGPEVGGAVGIQFYLADTFGTSLYVIGAIEILLTYIAPQAALFGEIQGNPQVLYNNLRVYGTILLLLMSVVVFVGVKFVSYFASLCLVCVIVAVVSVYAGFLDPTERANLCTVNGVALVGGFNCPADSTDNSSRACSIENPVLQEAFMVSRGITNDTVYDPNRNPPWEEGFEPTCQIGIPAITRSRTIIDNTPSQYLEKGEGRPGRPAIGIQVEASITSSFLVLIGIFFPSVTGIMTGSNRTGDLKDAQKSIPVGTIAAQFTTTILYITCVLFFGGTVSGSLLRDKFGDSTGDLTVSLLAFPTKWVILIGALLSTIGAGLQTLTSAPRVIQAIANDDLIPILKIFKIVCPLNHEPTYALILTTVLAEVGVLIASLDLVAPILSMFYLMCYLFVNMACTLQSLLKYPGWRPRFKFYHWSVSLLGALLCLTIMFMISWYYALVALVMAGLIYEYIQFRGAKKEWGDGIGGLSMEAARFSLLRLEERPPHAKNWRPQLLVLVRLDENLIPTHPKLLSFANQLKAGKGLILITSVLEGDFRKIVSMCETGKKNLKQFCNEYKVKGFVSVIASPRVTDGLSIVVQSAGLGGMTHNTVMIAWPERWRKNNSWSHFMNTIHIASERELAVLVPKGINWYPSKKDRMSGFIDVWWIVHDGGLLMLLPFLLRQNKVWRSCRLRIFAIAQEDDNSIQMKKDLAVFLHQLRIDAEVDVIEMPDTEISEFTYERTLKMEERQGLLREMRLTKHEMSKEIQSIMEHSFTHSRSHPEGFSRATDSISPTEERNKGVRFSSMERSPRTSEPQCLLDEEKDPVAESSESKGLSREREDVILRMHNSVRLNQLVASKSKEAALVIVNLPGHPKDGGSEQNYMEFLDVLTEGLDRVLMVRGGGREVVTVYS